MAEVERQLRAIVGPVLDRLASELGLAQMPDDPPPPIERRH
jgi:hypothetical protein